MHNKITPVILPPATETNSSTPPVPATISSGPESSSHIVSQTGSASPGWVSASTSLNMDKTSLPNQEATAMLPSLETLPEVGEKLLSPQLPRHEQACISS